MTEEMFWMIGLSLAVIGLLVIVFLQYQQIEQLKSRLNQGHNYEEPLAYLRNQLAGLPKVKAVKALRTQYPQLSLVDAAQLWERK
ncbi:MAG: hypothetical protein Q4P13_04700 [Psychrobacter sp.]|nr:hypothetical protein [Psychrobacter sp.]